MGVQSRSQFDRRRVERIDLRCRARIVIGTRHYAGWIDDISCAGAQLQTLTPIGQLGSVLLRLPDLRPLQCTLHWSTSHNAGVSFELPLSVEEFSGWVAGRAELTPHMRRLTIADITDLAA